MARKARIVAQDAAPRQAPWCLTSEEVLQLMQAFTADKSLIVEADALTLGHWAEHRKRGAWELALVLAGKVRVQVADGAVQLELSGSRNWPAPSGENTAPRERAVLGVDQEADRGSLARAEAQNGHARRG